MFEEIKNRWLFLKEHKVFLALSGGVDSVVLLHLLLYLEIHVTALHVNYQLRGEDSNEDENFTRKLCASMGVELHVLKVDTNKQLQDSGGNLQEVARNIRYDFFHKFLSENPNSYIAIGHHQDDQIETFFLNQARKSGLRGMSCMLEKDKNIVRPLLKYSKNEILDFAKINHWQWREDLSNQSLKYRRNMLRNQFIPEMEKQIPSIKNAVLTLIDVFQQELKKTQVEIAPIVQEIEESGLLSDKLFHSLTENQLVELCFQLGLRSSEIKEFVNMIHVHKGKRFILADGSSIFREKDGFSFEKFYPEIYFDVKKYEIESLPSTFSKSKIYLDADKINGELHFRTHQEGERIDPIGMKGSKLISDVLHDAKLLKIEANQWQVLVDGDGVISCPFITISRKKIADKNTERILCVEIQKLESPKV